MTTRLLRDLSVSAMGIGCMALVEQNYGRVDEAESERTLLAGLDAGINFWDTAAAYGNDHASETLVGRVLARCNRADVVVGTKFGLEFDIAAGRMAAASKPERIRQSCEESLRRLQTDYIDLYYLHRVDPTVPIADVWGELSLLVNQGKVRHVGMSEPGVKTLKLAHQIHPVSAVQNEYSLFSRDVEELLPTLRSLDIGLVAFAPIARGMLAGAVRSPADLGDGDFRLRLPRFQGKNLEANLHLTNMIEALARRLGVTPVQLSLAWLLSRGHDVVPIPGMETRSHLAENAVAMDIVLDADVLTELESIVGRGAMGDRYGSFDLYKGVESPDAVTSERDASARIPAEN